MYANIPRISAAFSRWVGKYGDPITIYRSSGNILTNAIRVKGRQLISPFEINFLRFMTFASDSGLVVGDHIKDTSTNEEFLVVATQVDTAVQDPMSIYAELYMVNYTSVTVSRQSVTYDSNLNQTGSGWNPTGTYPMVVEHVGGSTAFKDGLLLPTTVFRVTMQTGPDVQLNDRVTIDAKPYKVDDINLSISPGLQVLQLSVDTR